MVDIAVKFIDRATGRELCADGVNVAVERSLDNRGRHICGRAPLRVVSSNMGCAQRPRSRVNAS
jgi:hypothetical protein